MDGIGNQATFVKQLEILTFQTDSDIVYLAEDDFIYQENQFAEMIDFIRANEDVHFISPYDHLDFYTMDFHDKRYQLKISKNKHWRTATSCTCTFLTTKEILKRTRKVFSTYAKRKNTDGPIWLSLTKYNVFNLFKLIKYMFTSKLMRNFILLAWRYNFFQILFGKRYKLWIPIPAIATHLESEFLAPAVDWDKVFSQYTVD
jgi:hypothetical protein